jgi:alpha-L-rhamnosidase
MRRPTLALIALFAASPVLALAPANLKCEGLTGPIAIQSLSPRLSWLLQADTQSAYRILVASSRDLLDRNQGDLWDTAKVQSSETIQIPYQGRPLAAATEYFWKVQVWGRAGAPSPWSVPATFRIGLLTPQDWNAKWIAAQPDGETPAIRMPVFRRSIRLDQPVRRAIIYISGLGQYELSINGSKVGDAVLAPGWTNYRKTVYYNAYDVTTALNTGDNTIAVMLASGFLDVPDIPGRYTKLVESFGQPKLIARLQVLLRNGRTVDLVTDRSWQSLPGPIVVSHVYGGEDYDARLEPRPDSDWKAALEVAPPGGRLVAQLNPEIRVLETFHTVATTQPKPGIRVYDLGQNFSGWPRITVRGPAGSSVKMIPGELLAPDGTVSQRSSGSPQWFTYTLKGSGDETWSPRFSYYGFRYLQVEGLEPLKVEGQFIHSSAPVIGEFSCSKPLFNRIHKLIDMAILSNMQSVLTDCPHREKLGWLEESHLLGSAVMYNYGVEGLYAKISADMSDAITAEGLVPDIAPEYTVFEHGFRDSPEWGSAVVLDPWLAYKHYGNRAILAAHYDDMKRYVAYLAGKAKDGILSHGLGDWYDIGPKPPGEAQLTSKEVTATAIYYADLTSLAAAARLLDKSTDAKDFEAQARSVRAAYNARLSNPTSQTAYAMPLALGLAPEDRRAEWLAKLVADIRQHGNHTTAGDIGFHFVIQALSEGGRSDVIFDILANPEAPSYAAQLAHGATTLTEAWDANPLSSQNHFMLGHAEEWFYRYLAGIDVDFSRPAEDRIVLRPTPSGDVTSARATYQTPYGLIGSRWSKQGGKFVYDVELPPNTSAKVLLPGGGPSRRIEAGRHHFELDQ